MLTGNTQIRHFLITPMQKNTVTGEKGVELIGYKDIKATK